MGIDKVTEKKRVALTLDSVALERLNNLAAAYGVSKSAIVTLALFDFKPVKPFPVVSDKPTDYVV